MSVHIIVYKDGAKMMRPIHTREEYLKLRGSRQQQNTVKAVREGDEKQKSHLLQMNYSCLPTAVGKLKGATALSSTVGMDVDHIPSEKMQDVCSHILDRKEELGLLMLELSARAAGYHLVFRRREELTQQENLQWASKLLGVQFDEGAKDITRVFFTTTASEQDLLYLDDEIFEIRECAEPVKKSEDELNNDTDKHEKPIVRDLKATYNGILYTDIIRKYWELFNEGKIPVEGDRNVKTFELALNLRNICDFSLDRLHQVVPNYFGENSEGRDEWHRTLESALKEPRKSMPYRIRQVLSALKEERAFMACGGTDNTPPPMPAQLPPLIELLTRNVPDFYKPAVASAVFPALGTHLHGVKFRYWDNVEHEATFMSVLIGRQSIGKGTIKKPIEYIMEDIRLRDIPNRMREAEWKLKNPGAKQKKDPRPSDICIQMLIDNLTDAVFNQRIVDAHNNGQRFVYTFVDEVEALKRVTSKGSADEVGLLIRKAFDNALAGQERVGADSVSGIAPLRWNFNASTTPPNARRFFSKMVNDGTVSRLDISTLICDDSKEGVEDYEPIQGIYDNKYAKELKPYIDRLDQAKGLIKCDEALDLSRELKVENSDNAHLYDSEAYRVLSYRANVIAWLKGMVIYVAQGKKWDRTIADFVRWTEQYNLWCKMIYFGKQLEQELQEEEKIQHQSGPRNMLSLLPDTFTKEQYRQIRTINGHTGDGNNTLRVWIHRKYICFDDTSGCYIKTNSYKSKYVYEP